MKSRLDCHVILDPKRVEYHKRCLDSLENQDCNIHLIPYQSTISLGRLLGYSEGSGEFVTLLDDDDYLAPNVYAECLTVLDKHPDCIGVYTSEARLDPEGEILGIVPPLQEAWTYANMLSKHPYVHHGVVLRRAWYDEAKFLLEKYPNIGDQAMLLWLGKQGEFVHVPMLGYYWQRHSNQTVNKHRQEWVDFITWLKYGIDKIEYSTDNLRVRQWQNNTK